MEELELFKARVNSAIDKAYLGGVTLFNFLDEAQIGIILEAKKYLEGIYFHFNSGFKQGDRKRCIICPYDKELDFKICVYQIIYNKKFYEIGHRNVLGTLMSLGIKRECIGDIYIDEARDIFFACTKEVELFLLDQFKEIGPSPITLQKVDQVIDNVINYEDSKHFVHSLRLDAIIASAYNLSRKEVLEIIMQGLVYVKHVLNQNPSYTVKIGDEISVRHKGMVMLKEVGGTSKSGRLFIILAKRI